MFKIRGLKRMKMQNKLIQLEEEAKRNYLETVDWNFILGTCLTQDEKEEYNNLLKKLNEEA